MMQSKFFSRLFVLCLCLFATNCIKAQIITPESERQMADSIRRTFNSRSYFGLYKDTYFIGGTSVNGDRPDAINSDVKFQVSFRQRLSNKFLPYNTYAFLYYTQKCIWSVFQRSLPMRDLNFNPGIGISKLLIVKGRLIGQATVMIEHESNGRDRLASRSWNKISFGGNVYIDPHLMVHGKWWIPIVDGENNRDIVNYNGIGQIGLQGTSRDYRWTVGVNLVKRHWLRMSFNTTIDIGYRLRKRDNQFLYIQYYNGYGENLLDYNRFHNRIRIGLLIKPRFFSDY